MSWRLNAVGNAMMELTRNGSDFIKCIDLHAPVTFSSSQRYL